MLVENPSVATSELAFLALYKLVLPCTGVGGVCGVAAAGNGTDESYLKSALRLGTTGGL